MNTTTQNTKSTVQPVVAGLKTLLADSYSLMAQTHLAHWNVEGPFFFGLHSGFQSQYEELFEAVDEIAERLRALDEYAPGGLKQLGATSTVSEMSDGPAPAKDFLAHLIDGHEILLANAFSTRDAAGEVGDLETQDLVIGRIRAHQKALWMLKANLKDL